MTNDKYIIPVAQLQKPLVVHHCLSSFEFHWPLLTVKNFKLVSEMMYVYILEEISFNVKDRTFSLKCFG